jgi:hypothetical protein
MNHKGFLEPGKKWDKIFTIIFIIGIIALIIKIILDTFGR